MAEKHKRDGGIIIKEGFLMKRGHVRQNWKTRWFKLSDTSLRYYKRQKDKVPQGRISLRNATLSVHKGDNSHEIDREFVLLVETAEGVLYPIQAPSYAEMKSWLDCITDVIEHLRLEKEGYILTSPLPENGDGRTELSNAEVLGSYVDAYGGIKRETRLVGGVQRSDGFSGLRLRVWMEHTMGLHGSESEVTVSGLQRVGLLKLIDGDSVGDPFLESKYYILLSDEKALRAMVGDGVSEGPSGESSVFNSPRNSCGTNDGSFSSANSMATDGLSSSAVLPIDMPLGEIVKRGILFKKEERGVGLLKRLLGHVVTNWKARCFILQRFPATLSYFDPSKKNPKVINTLSLHGATVFSVGKMAAQAALHMRHPPDNLFCVKIATGTLYIIKASSADEREEWVDAIKPMCRKMRGHATSFSSVTQEDQTRSL